MPSQIGPYELSIEVQPRDHHRAHYETEGSRGAIKAACGGHPVVKVRLSSSQHNRGLSEKSFKHNTSLSEKSFKHNRGLS